MPLLLCAAPALAGPLSSRLELFYVANLSISLPFVRESNERKLGQCQTTPGIAGVSGSGCLTLGVSTLSSLFHWRFTGILIALSL